MDTENPQRFFPAIQDDETAIDSRGSFALRFGKRSAMITETMESILEGPARDRAGERYSLPGGDQWPGTPRSQSAPIADHLRGLCREM